MSVSAHVRKNEVFDNILSDGHWTGTVNALVAHVDEFPESYATEVPDAWEGYRFIYQQTTRDKLNALAEYITPDALDMSTELGWQMLRFWTALPKSDEYGVTATDWRGTTTIHA